MLKQQPSLSFSTSFRLLRWLTILVICTASCRPGTATTPPPTEVPEPTEEPQSVEVCPPDFFDDLQAGDHIPVGSSIFSQGVEFQVEEFVNQFDEITTTGEAVIEDQYADLGVKTYNVVLHIVQNTPLNGLTLIGSYRTGNLNLNINGQFINFNTPSDINGQTIGDVDAAVSDLGNDIWLFEFTGRIDDFSFGAARFWISDLCLGEPIEEVLVRQCAEFESLVLGTRYLIGDSFSDGFVVFTPIEFTQNDGSVTNTGFAEVRNLGSAGGSGQELIINNANISMDFGGPITNLHLRYAEQGGNLNIAINGEFHNFTLMSDLTGLSPIGGVDLVLTGGATTNAGVLELDGDIDSFSIGGAEFIIDDVCSFLPGEPARNCIDFEDVAVGTSFAPVTSFSSNGRIVRIDLFQAAANGSAEIDGAGDAGHNGNDLHINNVMASFDFGFSPLEALWLNFGEYGGELYLEINGDGMLASLMSEYDGITLGGVTVIVDGGLGDDTGILAAEGEIDSFFIAGQELWIDHVCPFLDE